MNCSKPDKPNSRAYWTLGELARRWACSLRKVQTLRAAGAFRVAKFGRSVRVPTSEVARYEAECLR